MLEIQRIMGENSMWATARERWKSVIPPVLAHGEVEVLHNSCLSLEAKDNTEGMPCCAIETVILNLISSLGNLILSLLILALLVPDARCRPDPNKIIIFVKVTYAKHYPVSLKQLCIGLYV